jgi:hypothetical protein
LAELFYLALPESLAQHEPEEAQGVQVQWRLRGTDNNSTKLGATLVTSIV